MIKCKVTCGEYKIILMEYSLLDALKQAIRLHDLRGSPDPLGEYVKVFELNEEGKEVGLPVFHLTKNLIEKCTKGFGPNPGQYQHRDTNAVTPIPQIQNEQK